MTPLIVAIGSGVVWFVLFIVGHIVWAHALSDRRYGKIILRCWIMTASGSVATVGFLHNRYWPDQLLSLAFAECETLLLMACAFICYVPFVFVISSSLSLDTLILLEEAAGRMQRSELNKRFASAKAAERRLEIMCKNGLLTVKDGYYQLTNRAKLVAMFFSRMKRFWKLWPGG